MKEKDREQLWQRLEKLELNHKATSKPENSSNITAESSKANAKMDDPSSSRT